MNILLIDNQSDTFAELESAVIAAGHDVTTIGYRDIPHYAADEYNAIILSGGWWYDDEVELLEQYAEELALIRDCPVPILGICIGMQLMHVALEQTVPLLDAPQSGSKQIAVTELGQKQYGFAPQMEVHKNHTRGILEVDPEFDVLATSPGHVEMMIHQTKPLLGVQFHPEVGDPSTAGQLINKLLSCIIDRPVTQTATNTRPVIAIPALRLDNRERPYSPYNYGIKHTFIQAVERAGGLPIIVPIYDAIDTGLQALELADGILFADGNDIEPQHYGQEARDIRAGDPLRDKAELALMGRAHELGLPILGVCRGMQLMNVYRGGTLYQDVVTERPDTANHDGYLEVKSTEHLAHILRIDPNSQLSDVLATDTLCSNTHHHQAVDQLGEGIVATAWAQDGVIEAIEDPSRQYFIGVQPHPESLFQRAEPEWQRLFVSFVDAARDYRTSGPGAKL